MNTTQVIEQLTTRFGEIVTASLMIIGLVSLVFSLLNCFMGYKLRKIWGCLLALPLGAAVGGVLAYYFIQNKIAVVLAALAGALLFAILAWLFYKMGLFILCIGLVYSFGISFIAEPTNTARIICLIIGIFAATLALGYEQWVIIGITGVCGGIGAVKALFYLLAKDGGGVIWVLGLILAAIGCLVQAAPLIKEGRLFDRTRRKKKNKGMSLPVGLPSKRKKKKVVYKTKVKEVETAPKPTVSSGGNKRVQSPKKDYGEEQNLRQTGRREEGRNAVPPVTQGQQGRPAVLDLDDLSRELSAEVQKIYEEDK